MKNFLIAYFPHISIKRYDMLVSRVGNDAPLLDLPRNEYIEAGWGSQLIEDFFSWKKNLDVSNIESRLGQEHIRIVMRNDPEYPSLLAQIPDAPIALFIRGSLDTLNLPIAIVGTRANSPYGCDVTNMLVTDLAEFCATIISGLALGIDGIAHESALRNGAKTIAILGGGIDRASLSPQSHLRLAEAIIDKGGALVSEYPPGTPPTPYTFPARNRIIAGMSLATVVIEAPKGSGALITARASLDYNREVCAVPQNMTSKNSVGANELLKQGAHPITSGADILDVLGVRDTKSVETKIPTLSPTESMLMNCLSFEKTHIDAIIKNVKLPSSDVMAILTGLMLRGLVAEVERMQFKKR